MNTTNQNAPQFFTLQIIHGALCLGVTLFLGVTVFLNYGKGHTDIQPGDVPLLYVAIAMAAMAPLLSNFLYQGQLARLDLSAPVKQRLVQYQTACIMRYALLEGSALFAVVTWFLTANELAALIAAAVIIYMIMVRPVKRKVAEILKVSYPDTLD